MSKADSAPSVPIDRMGLVAAIAAIAVAATGFGHSIPLFSVLLKSYGASDLTIGTNTGIAAVAAVIGMPFVPRLMTRFGLRRFLIACISIMVLSYWGLFLAGDRIGLWYPLRFCFGMAGAGLFAASETWINTLAPPHLRGKIIGIYGTFLAGGFAIGPLLIEVFGFSGFTPFGVGMVIFAAALIPILIARAPPPAHAEAATGFFGLLLKAPATFLSAAMFAGTEAAVLIFLPILTIEQGWGAEAGARAVAVYGLGIVSLQYAIGAYADKIGSGLALLLCAVGSAVLAAAFGLVGGSQNMLFAVLFIWGGTVAGLYTIGLTIIGERFGDEARAAANTGFVFMYGLGAMIGPVAAGAVRQSGGPGALTVFLVASLSAYAVLVAVRWRRDLP